MSRRLIKKLASSGAFASRGSGGRECMIVVGWTGLGDPGDDGRGHLVLRGRVSADLGMDGVPDPPFSSEEMQAITRVAKLEAVRCLWRRRKR